MMSGFKCREFSVPKSADIGRVGAAKSSPMLKSDVAVDSLNGSYYTAPAEIQLTPENVLYLQRTVGNQAVNRFIQAKLKVGQPDDVYEREADRAAEDIMHAPAAADLKQKKSTASLSNIPIQRQCSECEDGQKRRYDEKMARRSTDGARIQRQTTRQEELRKRRDEEILQAKEYAGAALEAPPNMEQQIQGLRGSGDPLPEETRTFFEAHFGQDLGDVRVHRDRKAAESAKAINARAYTTGQDIVFGAGEYSPRRGEGKRLLAHELMHVLQQNNNLIRLQSLEGNVYSDEPKYIPGDLSRLYWSLNAKERARINSLVDKVLMAETGITRKLDWNNPLDRPFAREWLRMRDRVIMDLDFKHILPHQGQDEKHVSTLCHRDFAAPLPGSIAQHCFVWGHPESTDPTPGYIRQIETMTFDDKTSGTPDPVPIKNTVCTNTYNVNPELVRQKYQELCNPNDYNLVSFNCCTCAYLALAAAGAKLSSSDFPKQNQGMGLPDSHGEGFKKGALESIVGWWNDIDELEKILTKYNTQQLMSVPIEMKAKWITRMCQGAYTTENEGEIVIKLFSSTSTSNRAKLYRLVEGHAWSGNWNEGLLVKDDIIVDSLYREQLNSLRDIINGK